MAIIFTAFLEVIGIASVLPFIHLVANPEAIDQNQWLRSISDFFNFDSYRDLLILTGVGMLLFLALANFFMVFTVWMQHRVVWDTGHNLSTRLLNSYLHRPYAFYLNKNTSELQSKIVMEVGQLCTGVILPLNELLSRLSVVLVIFVLLFVVDVQSSLVIVGVLGSAYFIAYSLRKGMLENLGKLRISTNLARFRSLADALQGIKTSKIYHASDYFYSKYFSASLQYSKIHPRVQLISIMPKSIIEIITFGGMIAAVIFMLVRGSNINDALPTITLYALAGYRLLPSLQKIFASATKLKHGFPVLDVVYDDLHFNERYKTEVQPTEDIKPFSSRIVFNNLNYQYEESDRKILQNISFEIKKGDTVAFVGSTGDGKTTLIDLMVGLLESKKDEILIDGVGLDKGNVAQWQQQIGYVQQSVFLFDDTILSNIAIGVDREKVDMDRLEKVCRLAMIHDFIEQELDQGYDTPVGERGVKLSGGQKQRLGIARALYRSPSILVLDEATSALDGVTESKVIDSLKSLDEEITIIIIAHRLSTVKHTDCIFLLKKGKILESGSYEKLEESSRNFKELIEYS
ncbi:MAG: ABC transporter ATP-binding protein [Bacteroidota bacterium]